MKILVVCGAGKMYGREVVTLSLMKGLRDRGHQLACLTSTWSDGKFQKQVESLSIPCTSTALGFISKQLDWSAFRMTLVQLIKLPVLWVRYRRTLKSFRPDVVLHSDFHHVFLLWPLLGAARNVFHVHDYFAPTRFYSRMFRLLCRRLDTVVAVSHFIGESLTRVGIPEDRIKCVLNGISLDKADAKAQDVAVSRQVRSEMCKPRVGIVGQVEEWKGHEDLIEALKILSDNRQPFLLQIFGTGNPAFMSKLKSKIEEYGFTDSVKWMGFVDTRERIYVDLDVCVVPSRFPEPFGMVAAEALSFGVPVIASRKGGLPEVIQDSRTGFLVDECSPKQLADKLSFLIRSPKARIEISRNARAYALDELGSKRMAEEMEAVLKRLTNGHAKSR